MKDKSQHSVRLAFKRVERHYGSLFPLFFKSITNGSEFLDSAAICNSCRNSQARTIFYYAYPYCASERGSNENANRFIRPSSLKARTSLLYPNGVWTALPIG